MFPVQLLESHSFLNSSINSASLRIQFEILGLVPGNFTFVVTEHEGTFLGKTYFQVVYGVFELGI